MVKFKITRILYGHDVEELIVEAETEEKAEEMAANSDYEDWIFVEKNINDCELITEKIRQQPQINNKLFKRTTSDSNDNNIC